MMKTSFGKMNTSITLQKMDPQIVAGGGRERAYVDIASVWAQVETQSNAATFHAGKPEYSTNVTFAVHYRKSFLKTRRIQMPGREFEVMSVLEPNMGRRSIIFNTREVQNTASSS